LISRIEILSGNGRALQVFGEYADGWRSPWIAQACLRFDASPYLICIRAFFESCSLLPQSKTSQFGESDTNEFRDSIQSGLTDALAR